MNLVTVASEMLTVTINFSKIQQCCSQFTEGSHRVPNPQFLLNIVQKAGGGGGGEKRGGGGGGGGGQTKLNFDTQLYIALCPFDENALFHSVVLRFKRREDKRC